MIKQFNLGLTASKKLAEVLEVETEKYWVGSDELAWDLMGKDELPDEPLWTDPTKVIPSPNLSELSEVFRMLGEKKGWGKGDIPSAVCFYSHLCCLWFDTQSQERCDEYFMSLITN
jgi:hypothetical protein